MNILFYSLLEDSEKRKHCSYTHRAKRIRYITLVGTAKERWLAVGDEGAEGSKT